MEKSAELLALQKEADSMRADFSLLRNQFLTERKKAEKQVASLREALKTQRSQLEKTLLVSAPAPPWRLVPCAPPRRLVPPASSRRLVPRAPPGGLCRDSFHVEKINDGNPVPNPTVGLGTSVHSLCLKLMGDFACVWAQP